VVLAGAHGLQASDGGRPLRHLRHAAQICRDYTTDNCEYDDTYVYDHYFETAEQVEEYMEAVLRPGKEGIRSRRPELLAVLA